MLGILAVAALALPPVTLAARPKVEVLSPDAQVHKGVPVAKIWSTGPGVEILKANKWTPLTDGSYVRTGDKLRTGAAAAAIEFPWTTLMIGPRTVLSIPATVVLTAAIDEGRVEQRAIDEDIVKISTAEAVIRGSGHVIVRRQGDKTFVSALEGAFDVATGPGTLRLEAGNGTIVAKGQRPSPPAALSDLIGPDMKPGNDPGYFPVDADVPLKWESPATTHHVQVLAYDTDRLVHDAEVTGTQYTLRLPLGLYRWRVSPLATDEPDGRPSPFGFICIVEN